MQNFSHIQSLESFELYTFIRDLYETAPAADVALFKTYLQNAPAHVRETAQEVFESVSRDWDFTLYCYLHDLTDFADFKHARERILACQFSNYLFEELCDTLATLYDAYKDSTHPDLLKLVAYIRDECIEIHEYLGL